MGVDRGVPGGPCQVLALSVGYVLSIPLDVSFSQSEVDHEDLVAGFVETNAEVVWLDISVDEVSVVDILNSRNHLINDHEHGLEGELAEGVLEEILKGGAQQVHHEHVVVAWVGGGVPSLEQ